MIGIRPDEGCAVLGRLLEHPTTQPAVLPIEARQWRQAYVRAASLPFFAELLAGEPRPATRESAIKKQLLTLPPAERRAPLEAHVRREVAHVLRVETAELDPDKPMRELGIDSLMAIELRNRLEATCGVELASTVIFRCPTMAALAQELARALDLPLAEPPPAAASPLEQEALFADILREAIAADESTLRSAVEQGNEGLSDE
jgi:myxalamid-type polyketide synthase MxaE and MxaD